MYDCDQVANLLKVSNKFFQNTICKAHEAKTGTDLKVTLYQASQCGIHVDFASPANLVQLFTGTLLGQGGILDKRVCVLLVLLVVHDLQVGTVLSGVASA